MFTSQQQKTREYCKYNDHCPSPVPLLEFTIRFEYIIIHNTNAFFRKTSFTDIACGVLSLSHPVIPGADVDVSEMSAVLIFYVENRGRMISKTLTIYETKGAVTQKITIYTFRSRQLQVSFTVLITDVYTKVGRYGLTF
jgi:hypothetical protein